MGFQNDIYMDNANVSRMTNTFDTGITKSTHLSAYY